MLVQRQPDGKSRWLADEAAESEEAGDQDD